MHSKVLSMSIIDALAIMDMYFFITHRHKFRDLSLYFFAVVAAITSAIVIAF